MFTYVLVLINVIIFVMVINRRLDPDELSMSYHSVFNRREYYRILSSAFTHQEIVHIACNMISLINIGPAVERIFGSVGMLVIYFGSMVLGKILALQIRHNKRDDYTMSLGASGAICGLIGAYLLVVMKYYGMDGLMSMGRSLLSLVIMSVLPGVDGTSHFSCMAMGMVIAWILMFFW
ncbi:MAG: rhomboid family intramembrane serine protease [Erysipelotrichaceae bacterium]|nr:rhomboid family intramembrane serine protease [Erysipelotrichaceae bacterium]